MSELDGAYEESMEGGISGGKASVKEMQKSMRG